VSGTLSWRRAWKGLCALSCAAACGAPAPERDSVAAPGPMPPLASPEAAPLLEDGQVGRIAGSPLSATELLVAWHETAPREPWLVVDRIVSTRLALLEAARLGLRIGPERIATAFTLERERQTAELQRAAQAEGVTLDAFLRQTLGQEPAAYWAALERRTLERLTVERVVRAWTLARPTRAVRCLALPEGGDVAGALARLEAGEDFVALVRELSVDDSRASDGLVPFLVDDSRSPLARVAFLTEPGAVGGPVQVAGHALFVRVEEARAPLEGAWPDVGEAVEASLAAHPLRDAEFLPWKLAMRRIHPVDLTELEKLFREP
jgi:hypothetical protein